MGGKYHLSWPSLRSQLRGKVTVWEPGKRLGLTWARDYVRQGAPESDVTVTVTFAERAGGGTVLTITQGPYGKGRTGSYVRSSDVAGWRYRCARLSPSSSSNAM